MKQRHFAERTWESQALEAVAWQVMRIWVESRLDDEAVETARTCGRTVLRHSSYSTQKHALAGDLVIRRRRCCNSGRMHRM